MEIGDEGRKNLREFMEMYGAVVKILDRDGSDWGRVSTYGWGDWEAQEHVRADKWGGDGCRWVVPEGAMLTERTYYQFAGTFEGNKDEVGVEAYPVSCACGKMQDVTLRYVGSLYDVIQAVLGYNDKGGIKL